MQLILGCFHTWLISSRFVWAYVNSDVGQNRAGLASNRILAQFQKLNHLQEATLELVKLVYIYGSFSNHGNMFAHHRGYFP